MRKFMRTRGFGSETPPQQAPAHPQPVRNGNSSAPKSNGHAKTAAAAPGRHDPPHPPHHLHRTLPYTRSAYWSGSEESRGREDSLWEDHEFPASWRSLGDKKLAGDLVWVRPHEVCSRPTFLSEESGESTSGQWCSAEGDARGGPLADRHVRVAASALAHTPRLLARVAPVQSFMQQYNGAFRFRFWVFGTWRDVVVDDRLPARGSRLLAAHPSAPADFMLPLLEKAYAKLYGSYAALRAGSVSRALQDLTGGVVQSFALEPQPSSLTAQVLHSAVPRSTLLVAVVPPGKSGAARALRNGLKSGCAYCVTGLARLRAEMRPEGEVLLVQMRATTAACAEWSGAWSHRSPEWRALPPPDRDLLAHKPGHFWMSLAELRVSFSALVLVHVGPDDWMREPALQDRRPWRAVLARRRWRCGYNAGGPPRALTTGTNPQFHLQIPGAAGANKCHALIALAQHYSVGSRARDAELHAVGFAVYAVGAGGAPRRPAHDSLTGLRALDVTHESRAREVVTFFTLPPGEYLVVPHTRRPHTETSFLLRIFTDECAHVWEVNDDNVIIDDIGGDCGPAGAARPAGDRWSGGGEENEVEAARLARWSGAPGLEVCRALVPLWDEAARGAVRPAEAVALVALCARWRAAFSAQSRCGSMCAYRLRAVLRSAGISVSNKVLECVVVRFARRARISADAFLLAVARLHLAHERHRILDAKLKSNPLSLEEMILMTVYS